MNYNLKTPLDFLNALKLNNNREWFKANKPAFDDAKEQFIYYVDSILDELKKMDENIENTLKAKDTIFRIYRDVRFSKNKEPYKTNFGASISKGGRKSSNAGYYIHLEPGNSFIGGGIYMPTSDKIKSIRLSIYNNPEKFLKIINDTKFRATFGEIHGEKLKSYPRGFDKNFEYIDLLKYKHYAVLSEVSDDFWIKKNSLEATMQKFKTLYPFVEYLNNIEIKGNIESKQMEEDEFIKNNFDL